ncbi:hypothetical protein IAR55_006681 [Kwoniella newhampshirensis]|uniref:Poly(A) polymerase RNA-binding domain-containing protein n=1 Tax=Kwoniella newhampshirensis TaxID=1651941 RepID=A0AAW0YUC8_9TREE
MVESRIRTLVQDLENTDNILTAHPMIGGIGNVFYCLTEEEQAAASQGELAPEVMNRKEEDVEGKDYKKIYTKNFFIGLEIEKKPKDGQGSRVLNLFYPSKRFCAACQQWEKYNEMEMSVILRPAKRSDLPPYCFPEGLPKSKKKAKRAQLNGTADVGAEESHEGQGPSKRSKATTSDIGSSGPQSETLPVPSPDETPASTPNMTPASLNLFPNGVPVPNGADPIPPVESNGVQAVDIEPPPGIENMPPLSATAMSSFATAAKGVATDQDSNSEGLLVLNGSTVS